MARRSFGANKAPRGMTILLAAVLVVVGIIGTFFHAVPGFAGISGETVGIFAYVLATLLMLVGIFTKGL